MAQRATIHQVPRHITVHKHRAAATRTYTTGIVVALMTGLPVQALSQEAQRQPTHTGPGEASLKAVYFRDSHEGGYKNRLV